jgi:hypothetical protein
VDPLPQDVIRGDAPTVSGDHEVPAGGLVPFGESKEAPTRPPINVMIGSWAPLGLPLATDVVSGVCADDGVYPPDHRASPSRMADHRAGVCRRWSEEGGRHPRLSCEAPRRFLVAGGDGGGPGDLDALRGEARRGGRVSTARAEQ